MTRYIELDALLAEIENLENRYKECPTRNSYEEGLKDGRLIGYKDALYKIGTLEVKEVEEEHTNRKTTDIASAMQEVEEKSRAFTEAHQGESSDEILAQMRGEESVSEDLEEAALQHLSKHYDTSVIWDEDEKCVVRDFKAGAEWQKQQDQSAIELAEDHAMLAGMEKMKEQMMKDAVDMVVGYWMPNGLMLAIDESENCYNIDDGDKVKVIVIKENQL